MICHATICGFHHGSDSDASAKHGKAPHGRGRRAVKRLMYSQLVPASQCFAEGIVFDQQSADLGAIFGWGFAPWTGGPMSHIDTIGMETFVRKAESLAQKYGARFNPPESFRDMAKSGDTLYGKAA